jgi:hypothetical protein
MNGLIGVPDTKQSEIKTQTMTTADVFDIFGEFKQALKQV